MLETSARLLALLSLLQSRPDWTGTELAARLDVSTRTVRNDIERLRALDYPVDATLGAAGGYRLGLLGSRACRAKTGVAHWPHRLPGEGDIADHSPRAGGGGTGISRVQDDRAGRLQ